MNRVQAIVPAAGRGERFSGRIEKPYVLLGSVPMLVHTLRALERVPEVDSIILVVNRARKKWVQQKFLTQYRIQRIAEVIIGGKTRMESVYAGLSCLATKTRWVLIHDGARPLVSPKVVSRLIQFAKRQGACCLGIRLKDTIKRVSQNSLIQETVDRDQLRAIQTPQVFRRDWLVRAYQRALKEGYQGTDDAALVERLGIRVKIVDGEERNIKITTPEDLVIARALLRVKSSC